MAVTISFLGAARTVTGSQFLVEGGGARICIDCGMSQGSRMAEGINRKPFAFSPRALDAVIVTHAHMDHVGKLPKLVKDGFSGPIFATPPTKDFAEILLLDSASLIADEAAARGEEPIFNAHDVGEAMRHFVTAPYRTETKIGDRAAFRFLDAGHVLGSAFIELTVEGKTIVFSGDLGNPPTPLLRPTENSQKADYCILESTYGNRIHEEREAREQKLASLIDRVIANKGTLLLPTFAFEKEQEILFEMNNFVERKQIPRIPVFIDSPLAIAATKIYEKYPEYYNREAKAILASGDKLFRFPGLTLCETVAQSKKINEVPPPKIIIAGSGMMTGGRILHHAARHLSDPNSILLFVGYQAAGSLGRRIFDGAQTVKIFDQTVSVHCLVKGLGAYSSHADQAGLVRWVDGMKERPKKVFVVHGEEAAALALRQRLRDDLGLDAQAPFLGDTAEV